MEIFVSKNRSIETSIISHSDRLEIALSELQLTTNVNAVKQDLHLYAPELFADLDIYTGQQYRLEATRRLVNLFIRNPDSIVRISVWRRLLMSDPVFKWVNCYPVITGYHKYCSQDYFERWEAAMPHRGFLKLFLK
jgi:hypothetical protein